VTAGCCVGVGTRVVRASGEVRLFADVDDGERRYSAWRDRHVSTRHF